MGRIFSTLSIFQSNFWKLLKLRMGSPFQQPPHLAETNWSQKRILGNPLFLRQVTKSASSFPLAYIRRIPRAGRFWGRIDASRRHALVLAHWVRADARLVPQSIPTPPDQSPSMPSRPSFVSTSSEQWRFDDVDLFIRDSLTHMSVGKSLVYWPSVESFQSDLR